MFLLFALFKFDPPGLETLESEADRLKESAPSETELRRNPPPVCPRIDETKKVRDVYNRIYDKDIQFLKLIFYNIMLVKGKVKINTFHSFSSSYCS